MAVPDYQSLMLPLLTFCAAKDDETATLEAAEVVARELGLSEEDIKEMLPSGLQSTFINRLSWASTYLKKAGLLKATRRGYYRITERGRALLSRKPAVINVKTLREFPEFVAFQNLKGTRGGQSAPAAKRAQRSLAETPLETLEIAYKNIRDDLAEEMLGKLKNTSPPFFEKIVVELLVKMGYGGSRSDAGKAIGRTGDGGIDGIIKEDKLGLDIVYLQAKRWDNSPVGRPAVMQFAGALQARRANKGVFITTSRFTEDARNYVSQIGSKIVLIDGEELTNLMIEHDVGVSTVAFYPVKKIDSDYFDESI